MHISDVITKYAPVEGDRVRMSCPLCGGKDTLTISKVEGKLLWNCYKASCKTKGVKEYSRSTAEIKNVLQKNYHNNSNYYQNFTLPIQFTNFYGNVRVIKYLKRNHCESAIDNKLFMCGNNATAILVEDVASACAVSHVATGVALMGTHMKDADLSVLKQFKEVKICLDPDATRKSLDLQKYLSYIVKCNILRIDDDLKYYKAEEIRKLVLNNN